MATYYIDSETFDTATAVFTDVELLTKAPDGYYRFNGTSYRQQSGGLLLTAEECPYPPATACPASVSTSTTKGLYTLKVNIGTGTGLVDVVVTRNSNAPIKIAAVYNEQAITNYYCGGARDDEYVYFTTLPGGCTIPSGATEIRTVQDWKWIKDPGAWADSGNIDFYLDPADFNSVDPSGNDMYLHLYKTDPAPTSIDVLVYELCDAAATNINVSCPAALTSFNSSELFGDQTSACTDVVSTTRYHNGGAAEPAIGDFVFTFDGTFYTLSDAGYYKIDGNRFVRVDDGGYVLDVNNC